MISNLDPIPRNTLQLMLMSRQTTGCWQLEL